MQGLIGGQADVAQQVRLQLGKVLAGLTQAQRLQKGCGEAAERGGVGGAVQGG